MVPVLIRKGIILEEGLNLGSHLGLDILEEEAQNDTNNTKCHGSEGSIPEIRVSVRTLTGKKKKVEAHLSPKAAASL